jgi:hypothetical protein
MAETPTLKLSLSGDERQNRNWELIDAALQRIATGELLARDIELLGTLRATRGAAFDGPVVAPAGVTAGHLEVSGRAALQDLSVTGIAAFSGPTSFPAGAISPVALGAGAAVGSVSVSEAKTAPVPLGDVPTQLDRLRPSASEGIGRWEILVAEATFRLALAGAVRLAVELHHGDLVHEVRHFTYGGTGIALDIPVTLFRVSQRRNLAAGWSLWASRTLTAGKGSQVLCQFAQLHAVELR